jgi:hypothetical protein
VKADLIHTPFEILGVLMGFAKQTLGGMSYQMNIRQVGKRRWSIVTRNGNDEPNFIDRSVEYIELDVVRM